MLVLALVVIAVVSYLLGSVNGAIVASNLIFHDDIRNYGSHNAGLTNFYRIYGVKGVAIVLAVDIGKTALALFFGKFLLGFFDAADVGALFADLCLVLGHMFPFYLRFKGGKGFASYLGMTLALNWKFALIVLVIVVAVTLITDYIVVGPVTTKLLVPAYLGFSTRDWILVLLLCVASAVILFKHPENYVRIWRDTEVGLRRANRGDDRVRK